MKRVPWWAVVVVFAVVVGGAIGGFAYLKGRASDPLAFCNARLPRTKLARSAVVRNAGYCESQYRGASGKIEFVVVRRKPDAFSDRIAAIRETTQLEPTKQRIAHRDAAVFRSSVQATAPMLVGVIDFSDETVELRFEPAVFTLDDAIAAMNDAAR